MLNLNFYIMKRFILLLLITGSTLVVRAENRQKTSTLGQSRSIELPQNEGKRWKKEVPLSIVNPKHYTPYNRTFKVSCLKMCEKILRKHGLKSFGSHENIQYLMRESGKRSKTQLLHYGNNVAANYKKAIACIDRHLEKNRPIIVGVNHTLNYKQNEGTTDHYVVIVGRGYDEKLKKVFYTYYDPATTNEEAGVNVNKNRLIYDPTDYTFYDKASVMKGGTARYDVTAIRPND